MLSGAVSLSRALVCLRGVSFVVAIAVAVAVDLSVDTHFWVEKVCLTK